MNTISGSSRIGRRADGLLNGLKMDKSLRDEYGNEFVDGMIVGIMAMEGKIKMSQLLAR
jgi:hypothetical protein